MYHRGWSNAEEWRLKTVPAIAFNRVGTNLMEGGLDVYGGAVRSSPAGGPRRRDEHPGSGASIRAAPGHGAQDAQVLVASGVSTGIDLQDS